MMDRNDYWNEVAYEAKCEAAADAWDEWNAMTPQEQAAIQAEVEESLKREDEAERAWQEAKAAECAKDQAYWDEYHADQDALYAQMTAEWEADNRLD